jgi:hypothetical protein
VTGRTDCPAELTLPIGLPTTDVLTYQYSQINILNQPTEPNRDYLSIARASPEPTFPETESYLRTELARRFQADSNRHTTTAEGRDIEKKSPQHTTVSTEANRLKSRQLQLLQHEQQQ